MKGDVFDIARCLASRRDEQLENVTHIESVRRYLENGDIRLCEMGALLLSKATRECKDVVSPMNCIQAVADSTSIVYTPAQLTPQECLDYAHTFIDRVRDDVFTPIYLIINNLNVLGSVGKRMFKRGTPKLYERLHIRVAAHSKGLSTYDGFVEAVKTLSYCGLDVDIVSWTDIKRDVIPILITITNKDACSLLPTIQTNVESWVASMIPDSSTVEVLFMTPSDFRCRDAFIPQLVDLNAAFTWSSIPQDVTTNVARLYVQLMSLSRTEKSSEAFRDVVGAIERYKGNGDFKIVLKPAVGGNLIQGPVHEIVEFVRNIIGDESITVRVFGLFSRS